MSSAAVWERRSDRDVFRRRAAVPQMLGIMSVALVAKSTLRAVKCVDVSSNGLGRLFAPVPRRCMLACACVNSMLLSAVAMYGLGECCLEPSATQLPQSTVWVGRSDA